MKGFFHPESVAIVGVSESKDNLGRQISANMQRFTFDGIIYEVGLRGGSIFGRRIYRAVSDIPDHVDLAVVLTPAHTVPDIMSECGRKGIRRVVVETAGFGEYGAEGAELQERVHAIAREHDIRFVGPNCIGVINRHNGLSTPFIGLDETVRPGRISVVSQSGGVGISILNVMVGEGLGLSKLVSVGNKLDVDENDLLEYLIDDPDTEIICMYLEGIHDGRRLIDLARRSTKPILVHKSNIGHAASRIASSHTGSLAADDAVVDAALRQSGIARFRDPETLVHYLKALAMPPLVGNRLAVLSRSGGHAIIAADEIDLTGLQLSELPTEFLDEVQEHLRAHVIRLTNPMDLGDLFDIDLYALIAERTINMDVVDGMVYLHTYAAGPEGEKSVELFRRLRALSLDANKPIAIHAATVTSELSRLKRTLDGPLFSEPSDAVQSLALLRDFRHRVVRSADRPEGPDDRAPVKEVLDRCRRERRDPLIQEAMAIGDAYGVPIVPGTIVSDADAAVEAAEAHGFPVAMKIVSREVSHKSDFGGVQLNLRSPNGVRSAWTDMMASVERKTPDAHIEGVLVQPMILGERDVIVGAKHDPNFGHIVLVGMGGIFVEIFRDTALRVTPFERDTAEEMLRELKIYPILAGARGQQPADIEALLDAVLAVARLVTDFPEIIELDLNPVRVLAQGEGCLALDARIGLDLD